MQALLTQADAVPAAADPGRLRPADFDRLGRFIHEYSGIKMPRNKLTMVELRLQRRLKALGMTSMDEYCRFIFDGGGLHTEAVRLIDVVTTNKTDFFREAEHFKALAEIAVPQLLQTAGSSRDLSIWSAACSTGAEPYSIAMVLDDLTQRLRFRYSVIATDICTEVLETAVSGIYPAAQLDPAPDALRRRYVQHSKDRKQGLVRIAPELRSKVRFGRLNLMDPVYPAPKGLDVIFCRNVLIYFDKPTQENVVRKLCGHLRPGGFLFLGHSETVLNHQLPLVTVGPSMFRRK